MSISQNFPEEGPTLNLNFAGSRTLDPRITFTRTSSATFMGRGGLVTIAPANSARFDHRYNPTTGEVESLGLLVEEARSNVRINSEVITAGNYALVGTGNLTQLTTTTPISGLTTATKFFFNVGANTGNSSEGFNFGGISLSDSTVYTQSIFVKASGSSNFRLRSNVTGQVFDIPISGPAPAPTGTITACIVTPYPDGWSRISWTYITTTSVPGNRADHWAIKTDVADGSSGFLVTGAQLEVGSFPTSYIPTTTSTVTRTADNASITGSNFTKWYNQSEGTIVCNARVGFATAVQTGYLTVYNNLDPGQNRISIRIANTISVTNGVSQLNYTNTPSIISGTYVNIATTYKKNDYAQYANGNLIQTDNNIEVPISINTMEIGAVELLTVLDFNSTISKITYYPNRLTNSQLIALTR